MSEPISEFPWSDLVWSEDGTRLTAAKTGLYVLNPDLLWRAQAGGTVARVEWISEPVQDEPPCQLSPA